MMSDHLPTAMAGTKRQLVREPNLKLFNFSLNNTAVDGGIFVMIIKTLGHYKITSQVGKGRVRC